MKRAMATGVLGVMIAAASVPGAALAGDRDWATAGKILTGVVIGGVLQNVCVARPACPPVVYAPPVACATVVRPCVVPPVRDWREPGPRMCEPVPPRWCPPAVVYCPPTAVYCPPVPVYCPPVTVCAPPVVQRVETQVVVVQPEPATETVWIVNSNGSRTPVVLRRADGGQYVGPKGEYYQGLPSNEQLRQIYGM